MVYNVNKRQKKKTEGEKPPRKFHFLGIRGNVFPLMNLFLSPSVKTFGFPIKDFENDGREL